MNVFHDLNSMSLIISIAGAFATLIFGLLSFDLFKKYKYPGQLIFIKEAEINLFNAIVKNMPKITVKYNEEPVNRRLVLIKGVLMNIGKKDITKTMYERGISIKLLNKFKSVEANIVNTSPNINAKIDMFENEIILDTGLFKRFEFIRIEILLEIPEETENIINNEGGNVELFEGAIAFEHRIADTQKIKCEELNHTRPSFSKFRIILFSLCIIFAIGGITVMSFVGPKKEITVKILDNKYETSEFYPKIIKGNKIVLKDTKHKLKSLTFSSNEFSLLKKDFIICQNRKVVIFIMACLFGFYLLFPAFMLIYMFLKYKRYSRINKIIMK